MRAADSSRQGLFHSIQRVLRASWSPFLPDPISVVQTLAHNSTATLSVIRDYLVQKLQKQSQQIAQDELRVRRYREETTRIRQEIQELKARYLATGYV